MWDLLRPRIKCVSTALAGSYLFIFFFLPLSHQGSPQLIIFCLYFKFMQRPTSCSGWADVLVPWRALRLFRCSADTIWRFLTLLSWEPCTVKLFWAPLTVVAVSKLDEITKVLSFFSTKRKITDFWRPSQMTCQIFPGTFQLRENIYMCNSQRRYRQIWSVQQVLLIAWRKMILCVKLRPFSQPYTRSLLLLLFYLFASLFKIFILLVGG